MVNLVLDASKLEAGQFEMLPEPFDISALIAACCDMVRLKADKGRITLVRAPIDVPGELIADKRACRQIVLNLLSNAVKFTLPEGQVTIGAQSDGTMLTLYVEDTGIGIAGKATSPGSATGSSKSAPTRTGSSKAPASALRSFAV